MARKRRGADDPPRARLVVYRSSLRPIGIRWWAGGRSGEASAGTTDRDEAIGAKALLLRDLAEGRFPGEQDRGPSMAWPVFRERYFTERVALMSNGSRSAWISAANHLERVMHPRRLCDLDKALFSKFRARLLEEGLSPNSAATYLRTIRAALGWAEELDLIDAAPRVKARAGLRRSSGMRSRPVNEEEFERILMAAHKIRPHDSAAWVFFLRGLRLSSLRVDELRRLTWDESGSLTVDTTGRYPMLRMLAEGHKSRRDCLQPITPEFWALIDRRGVSRSGPVFPLPCRKGDQMTRNRVIRVIGEIGRKAGVVTNTATGKTATSHDIGRRAFLTAMASKLTTSQTQQFARHSDPSTTTQFYVRHEAEALAEAVGWGKGVAVGVALSKT